MPEITKDMWSVIFPMLIGGFVTGIGGIISFAVWKANKTNKDLNQDNALKKANEDIKALQTANKGFGESLSKIQTMIESQGKDIESLKKESEENDKSFDEIKDALKELLIIPTKLDALEKQQINAFSSFEKYFNERIENVKEKVDSAKPVRKSSTTRKSTKPKVN